MSVLTGGYLLGPCGHRSEAVYDHGVDNTSDVSAFILAGGKSSRMGTDKAFAELGGRTLLSRALDIGRSVTLDVHIVGNRAKFSAYAPVVEDIFRECGPLGGIHAALRASSNELNLILAVDIPFVSRGLLQYLIGRARDSSALVTVPRVDGGWQPLCAVYRREFADAAEETLNKGKCKIDALFDVVGVQVIEEAELAAAGFSSRMFQNLNTKEEVESAVRKMKI